MTSYSAKSYIGVISDTHGLLRPEAVDVLRGSELILHAGDVGKPGILDELRSIAPLIAVRGNVDGGDWAEELPMSETIEFGGHHIHMRHILADLDISPATAGFAMVIFGHSHRPEISEEDGVTYFNPGSAGPPRFQLPVTVGRLTMQQGRIKPEIIDLFS